MRWPNKSLQPTATALSVTDERMYYSLRHAGCFRTRRAVALVQPVSDVTLRWRLLSSDVRVLVAELCCRKSVGYSISSEHSPEFERWQILARMYSRSETVGI